LALTLNHGKVRKVSWFYISSCQSQGGELALTFIMPESGGKCSAFHDAKVRELSWFYLASCQSQEGRLALRFIMPRSRRLVGSTFHPARVREVSWLGTFHHIKARKVSLLYLSSCQNPDGELGLPFIMRGSGRNVCSIFHHKSQESKLALPFIRQDSGR
jgi:hypothetical protein